MIVTISRQMGARGGEVARQVAEALQWRLVDNELIEQIAARSGLTREEVAEKEERAPGFLERLIRLLTRAAPEILVGPAEEDPDSSELRLVKITEGVVADVAKQGRLVLVGRAAPAVLKGDHDALHVKIVAPKADRIRQVAVREELPIDRATEAVEQSDGARRLYHQQYYGQDWNDASLYHMVLNTSLLGFNEVVDTVIGRAKSLWPAVTRERRTGAEN